MRLVLIIFQIIIWLMQVNGQNWTNFHSEVLINSNQNRPDHTEQQIAGSASPDMQFIPGIIIKTDGTEIKDISMRYNIFSNTMQFKKNGTILDIYETNTIKRVILGDKIFVYAPYNASKKIRLSYFQVLNEGKFQLLKKYNIVFKGSGEKPGVGDSIRFETTSPSYYLRYADGMANLIDSQKKLIMILQPIPQKIIDYIRENNTNVNNEKELIDLLEYTNNLMY